MFFACFFLTQRKTSLQQNTKGRSSETAHEGESHIKKLTALVMACLTVPALAGGAAGEWFVTKMGSDGFYISPRVFGLIYILSLKEDGTGTFITMPMMDDAEPAIDELTWSNDENWLQLSDYDAPAAMTVDNDTLSFDSPDGTTMVFTRINAYSPAETPAA